MNVSLMACRWRFAVTSRSMTIVSTPRSGSSSFRVTGYVLSSIQRSSGPRARSSIGPPMAPSRRGVAVRVLELREDLDVGLLLDVREDALRGRVGQADPPVVAAHEDPVAHRPDHRVQLGGLGVLRLGQPTEVGLGLDPVGDVAGDGDDPAVLSGWRDVLEQHLDGDRPAVAVAER